VRGLVRVTIPELYPLTGVLRVVHVGHVAASYLNGHLMRHQGLACLHYISEKSAHKKILLIDKAQFKPYKNLL
jgi:hypothetical protein